MLISMALWMICKKEINNVGLKINFMTPNITLSVDEIRSQFPALNRVHNGFPVAYFDGPGGTQVPRSVVEA
jgi:hypothetical protein